MTGTALSDADIMAAYDAEIMRNGSADSVLLRTVKACIAADCRLTAEQPVAWKWTNSETGGSGYLPERKLDFPYAHLYSWQPLYARAPVTAEQGGALAALLQELRAATDLEGFGCACDPNVQCGVCKARSVMFKLVTPLVNKYAALTTQPQAEPAALREAAMAALNQLDLIQPQNMGPNVHRVRLDLRAALATPTAPTEPT